jgi:Icc protein
MINLIQITDSHLGLNDGDTLLSMNPDDSLKHVLKLVKQQQPKIDLLLATGDIVNEHGVSVYQRFVGLVSTYLPAQMAWLPGNHDNLEMMEAVIKESSNQVIVKSGWAIILLDSHVVGETHGNFSDLALSYLSSAVEQHQDKHILISFHHQPVPIGSKWMDRYIIQNAHAFWQAIDGHKNIKAILWGHVHQEFDEHYKGIQLLSAPSTCIQFTPNNDEFAVEDTMPGYRWLELYDDGDFKTGVERVEYRDYGIDFTSHGY